MVSTCDMSATCDLSVMQVQGRDSQEALQAHLVSQCTASASPVTGLLAVVRARQLAIVDLAAAATAALAPAGGTQLLLGYLGQQGLACLVQASPAHQLHFLALSAFPCFKRSFTLPFGFSLCHVINHSPSCLMIGGDL